MCPAESLSRHDVQMAGAFDNIHPGLSQEEAIRLLSLPVEELASQSDPYMAAAHLINFPGPETEAALLALVKDPDQTQPRRLARRKSVEVLGRLGCVDATTAIGDCLNSDDPYLVENAAFALQLLNCGVPDIHRRMIQLLQDPAQNQRVLVQSLAALDVQDALPAIEELQAAENSGVRGAAISAAVRLGGPRDPLHALGPLMLQPNQMDRQTAIQDAINAGGHELLPHILSAPVSPVFRMRAVRALWPAESPECHGLQLTDVLDALLHDRPQSLELVHAYDQEPTDAFLIQEFFGTDFSRSYLALQTLQSRSPQNLWPLLKQRWDEEAHNDYGAHYFFIRLFGVQGPWPDEAQPFIRNLLNEASTTRRPQFMKSKPAAVLAMGARGWLDEPGCFDAWLNPETTPFWEVRYAALMLAPAAKASMALSDPEPYVVSRAKLSTQGALLQGGYSSIKKGAVEPPPFD